MQAIDWQAVWVPTMSLLEVVARGSVVYLGLVAAMRVSRREGGSLNTADLLMIVLVANAVQNAMSSTYNSITEGAALVGTLLFWNYALDWLAFHSPRFRRLMQAAPLPLVVNGQLQRSNMHAELLSVSDLRAQLRKQGIEHLRDVKRCYLESDGNLSVIKQDHDADDGPRSPNTGGHPGH